MRRRDFFTATGSAAAAALLAARGAAAPQADVRPNILWVSAEDISPDLGCYGDPYAVSPHIDAFAETGLRYTRALGHMGVCAPVRSGIITAMYPTTIGTNHMRCSGVPPAEVRCFTEYLRAAGYYCTNRSKTDYQFPPPMTAWDENGPSHADWDGRDTGQPFFSVINFTNTHESQIRSSQRNDYDELSPEERHDPAKAVLAPYHPDTPRVRGDYAQYADNITLMDKMFQGVLDRLAADGLAEDTIVFFWGDHGRGLPRGKRWIYDSGIQFPLIVHVPQKWRAWANEMVEPGSLNGEMVGFLDLGPTVLSLAGVSVPAHMQGQAFLGPYKAAPRDYIFSARDRIDEAYDLMRSVRDKRYKYIRNFMHHLSYALDVEYMNLMPTMQEMRRLHAEGRLEGPEKLYFLEPRPVEELYDIDVDPHEVKNLAGDPAHASVVARMRQTLYDWMIETGDFGLIPEAEFDAIKWPGGEGKLETTHAPVFSSGSEGKIVLSCQTPGASIAYRIDDGAWKLYAEPIDVRSGTTVTTQACRIGFRDSEETTWKPGEDLAPRMAQPRAANPHWRSVVDSTDLLKRLLELKKLDGKGAEALPAYHAALKDPAGALRYWAAVGLRVTCEEDEDIEAARAALTPYLEDDRPVVRIAAAQAVCQWDGPERCLDVIAAELEHPLDAVRLHAITALSQLGAKARPVVARIRTAQAEDRETNVKNVATQALRGLEG